MLKNSALYVYEVYRERSFSKAAQKLFISQPALSSAIQKEEINWGCAFFDRSTNPVELTSAGQYYISVVEKMKQMEEELEAYFDHHVRERQRKLNLGAPAFFCAYLLPSLVKEFNEQHPGCRVNIIEAGGGDLVNCLQIGTIDVCLTVDSYPAKTHKTIPIGEEELVLAVPKDFSVNETLGDFRLTIDRIVNNSYCEESCPKVSIGVFKDCPFLLLKQGNDLHDRCMQICQQENFTPNVFITLDQLLTAYHMAAAGMGVALIRAGMMKYGNLGDDLCFYRLDSPYTIRKINLVSKKSVELPMIVKDFISYLSKRGLN